MDNENSTIIISENIIRNNSIGTWYQVTHKPLPRYKEEIPELKYRHRTDFLKLLRADMNFITFSDWCGKLWVLSWQTIVSIMPVNDSSEKTQEADKNLVEILGNI